MRKPYWQEINRIVITGYRTYLGEDSAYPKNAQIFEILDRWLYRQVINSDYTKGQYDALLMTLEWSQHPQAFKDESRIRGLSVIPDIMNPKTVARDIISTMCKYAMLYDVRKYFFSSYRIEVLKNLKTLESSA